MRFKITKNTLNLNNLTIEEKCIGNSDTFVQIINNILMNEDIVDYENYRTISTNLQLIKKIIIFLNDKFPDIKLTSSLYYFYRYKSYKYNFYHRIESNNLIKNEISSDISSITTSMSIIPKNFNIVDNYNTDGMLKNIAYKNILKQPLSLIKPINTGRLNSFENIVSLTDYLKIFLIILKYANQEYQAIGVNTNYCTTNNVVKSFDQTIDLIRNNWICVNSILRTNSKLSAKDIWNARRLLIDAWTFACRTLELICTIYFTKKANCINLNDYFSDIMEMTNEINNSHIPIRHDGNYNVYSSSYEFKKPVHIQIMRELEHKYLNRYYNFLF